MNRSKDTLLILVACIISSIFLMVGISIFQWYSRTIGVIIIAMQIWLSDTGMMYSLYNYVTELLLKMFNKE